MDLPQVPMGELCIAGQCPLQLDGSSHLITATVISGFLRERLDPCGGLTQAQICCFKEKAHLQMGPKLEREA